MLKKHCIKELEVVYSFMCATDSQNEKLQGVTKLRGMIEIEENLFSFQIFELNCRKVVANNISYRSGML